MERQIVIGLITNTEYLKRIKEEWNSAYIESQAASALASWCWEYFEKRGIAPMRNIETILINKLKKKKIKKELAEEIETTILSSLNDQYENSNTDLESLLADTREYFIERQLDILTEGIQNDLSKGKLNKAKKKLENFKLIVGEENLGIDLADVSADNIIDEAFAASEPLIKFPGALGEFLNSEMTKGSFISFLAPEKRGKTFLLLYILILAYEQGVPVALFQAGDMTEAQQVMRLAISLTKKSNKEKFCGKQYIPVLDCVKNQNDTCNRKIRACKFGVFTDKTDEQIRKEITYDELVEAKKGNKFYKNCYNCINWSQNPWGTVWLEEFDNGDKPLTPQEAKKARRKFFKNKNLVRISTHANGELTIPKMFNTIQAWHRTGFVPKIILLDYADLVAADKAGDFRHLIDFVWRKLRGGAQLFDCLMIAPTQADAKSYEQELLKLGNFSEDKRKLAHVTAMYGLNQDPGGREKKLSVMRINKVVVREDGFHFTDQVHVLQSLRIGQPHLGSYL